MESNGAPKNTNVKDHEYKHCQPQESDQNVTPKNSNDKDQQPQESDQQNVAPNNGPILDPSPNRPVPDLTAHRVGGHRLGDQGGREFLVKQRPSWLSADRLAHNQFADLVDEYEVSFLKH